MKSDLERCLEQAGSLPANHQPFAESFCRDADARGSTGAAFAITDGIGAPVSQLSYGRRCDDARDRVAADTLFPIGSLTKSATALVVLDLLDKNRRSLSDSLDPDGGAPPVIDLLRHSAGSRAGGVTAGAQRTQAGDRDRAAHFQAWFEPGELWHYDNANYVELARELDALGWDLSTTWAKRFAKSGPQLGLNSAKLTTSCEHTWVGGEPRALHPQPSREPAPNLAGGAWASASGVIELLRAIAAEPRTRTSALPTLEADRYGLGIRIAGAGEHESWGHTGAGMGSWAWMRGDASGRAAVLLSNRNVELADIRAQLREGFFHLDSPPAPAELLADQLAGAYRVRGWDEPAQIRHEDGELFLDAPSLGTAGVSLRPDGRNRFAAHLPMQAGSQSLIFVESKGQIWLRSPWFVARKIESQ